MLHGKSTKMFFVVLKKFTNQNTTSKSRFVIHDNFEFLSFCSFYFLLLYSKSFHREVEIPQTEKYQLSQESYRLTLLWMGFSMYVSSLGGNFIKACHGSTLLHGNRGSNVVSKNTYFVMDMRMTS